MSLPDDQYVGEPAYPAPWSTRHPREGMRDTDAARIVSLAPDVCLTPVGSSVVPVPYPVVDFAGHDDGYTPSVRMTGQKSMVLRSRTSHVHGDAPGVRKEVKSGTVGDVCEPIGHTGAVRAEGSNVIRHLDRCHMNANTQGECLFVRDQGTHDAPDDTDPVPGSVALDGRRGAWGEPTIMTDAPVEYAYFLRPTPPGRPYIPGPDGNVRVDEEWRTRPSARSGAATKTQRTRGQTSESRRSMRMRRS